jgi:hypothetical protein
MYYKSKKVYMSLELHEQDQAVYDAIKTRDSEALYQLAAQVKEQGEDEQAEALLAEAKRIDKEDWAYDNAIGN